MVGVVTREGTAGWNATVVVKTASIISVEIGRKMRKKICNHLCFLHRLKCHDEE